MWMTELLAADISGWNWRINDLNTVMPLRYWAANGEQT
jgi:hypothetical protein